MASSYVLVNFNGEIAWVQLVDGTFCVDPTCEAEFLETFSSSLSVLSPVAE